MTALQTRASRHEPDICEFNIMPVGIVLGEPVTNPTRYQVEHRARIRASAQVSTRSQCS